MVLKIIKTAWYWQNPHILINGIKERTTDINPWTYRHYFVKDDTKRHKKMSPPSSNIDGETGCLHVEESK